MRLRLTGVTTFSSQYDMVTVGVRPTFWAVTGVKEDDWSEGVVTEVSSRTRLALGLGRLILVGARHTPHWLVTALTAVVA